MGLTDVHINASEKRILLNWSVFTYLFDFDGNFLGRSYRPEFAESDEAEKTVPNVAMINENLFAVGFYTPKDHQENAAMIYDKEQNIINVLKSYKDRIQPPGFSTYNINHQGGSFHWCMDQLHYYRGLSDTIYTFEDRNKSLEPYLVFDFGKHSSNYNYNPGTENEDAITVQALSENNRALFVDFFSTRMSPEPYEGKVWRSTTGWLKGLFNNFYAVYDKEKEELYCLLQPTKSILGLNNDLDNGIPFWPKSISNKNELIDYYHAYKFLEHANKITNPGEAIKELIQNIDEEDNPIIIIATGK